MLFFIFSLGGLFLSVLRPPGRSQGIQVWLSKRRMQPAVVSFFDPFRTNLWPPFLVISFQQHPEVSGFGTVLGYLKMRS